MSAPVVGILAERAFGFKSGADPATHGARNAAALASSLLWCLVTPWFLCMLSYQLLHKSFAVDRLREPPEKRSASDADACGHAEQQALRRRLSDAALSVDRR